METASGCVQNTMTSEQQIEHFENDLDALVERYRKEFDMTYAAVIGCLQLQIHALSDEAMENAEGGED